MFEPFLLVLHECEISLPKIVSLLFIDASVCSFSLDKYLRLKGELRGLNLHYILDPMLPILLFFCKEKFLASLEIDDAVRIFSSYGPRFSVQTWLEGQFSLLGRLFLKVFHSDLLLPSFLVGLHSWYAKMNGQFSIPGSNSLRPITDAWCCLGLGELSQHVLHSQPLQLDFLAPCIIK